MFPQVTLLPPKLSCSNMPVLLRSSTATQVNRAPQAALAGAKVKGNVISHNSETVLKPY